jgi:hypothetical protein
MNFVRALKWWIRETFDGRQRADTTAAMFDWVLNGGRTTAAQTECQRLRRRARM